MKKSEDGGCAICTKEKRNLTYRGERVNTISGEQYLTYRGYTTCPKCGRKLEEDK